MKACIIGSTGYAGQQLASLLMMHPEVDTLYLGSHSSANEFMSDQYSHLKTVTNLRLVHSETLIEPSFIDSKKIDLVFMALPHSLSSEPIHSLLPLGVKIVDLGADFRIKNASVYSHWYGTHPYPEDINQSVYGLSEVMRNSIKNAQLIANPGCYATATLLAALPAIQNGLIGKNTLYVDAKSGVSGAGRQSMISNLFAEVSENIRPYNVGIHRHTPEIEEQLTLQAQGNKAITIHFSPSVVPMTRGMISAVYAPLEKSIDLKTIKTLYQDYYESAHFIRHTHAPPISKAVRGSNFADLWVHIDERTNTFTAMCAIDNLMKGAAGQAIQNMNIMMGFDESTGLTAVPLYP